MKAWNVRLRMVTLAIAVGTGILWGGLQAGQAGREAEIRRNLRRRFACRSRQPQPGDLFGNADENGRSQYFQQAPLP